MLDFPLHDPDTAPERSRPLLARQKAQTGMVPNLLSVMAEAPDLLEGYLTLHRLFQQTSFTPEELTVVWQSINVEHDCHYCVPAHTGVAHRMKVDPAITQALRDETPLPDPRLEALRDFTLAMVRERGAVEDDVVERFLDAGFTRQQVLEVVLGISQKVMSNYTNRLAQTPVDAPFRQFAWQRASRAA